MTADQLEPLEFAPEELFFSTTDSRGVIVKANGVFVRLSGHPWERLVGSPHNIIRHDEMPGGAFRLMWAALRAGEPFCAYVVNRSASGRPYTVFATITPLADGFLSVRSRPCVPELADAALSACATARLLERQERTRGVGAPAAAVVGERSLLDELAGLGFDGYDAFTLAALPAEVAARATLVQQLPVRKGTSPLHELLAAVHRVDAGLVGWLEEMTALAELARQLSEGAAALSADMELARTTADQVAAATPGRTAPVMLAVRVWASMLPEIDEQLAGLRSELVELADSCARTRFRIALARLHNDASAQFAAEMIDLEGAGAEGAGRGSGLDAITDLTTALDEGVAAAVLLADVNAQLAVRVAAAIETVAELMLVPQGLLGNWQEMVSGCDDEVVASLLPSMASQVARGEETIRHLAQLAAACRRRACPLEGTTVGGELQTIRSLVDRITPGDRPRQGPMRGLTDPPETSTALGGPRRGA